MAAAASLPEVHIVSTGDTEITPCFILRPSGRGWSRPAYVFQAPDGLGRAALEHRLLRPCDGYIASVMATGCDPQRLGGLASSLMRASSDGGEFTTVIGPPGTAATVHALRHFVRWRHPRVLVRENAAALSHQHSCGGSRGRTTTAVYRDAHVHVWSVTTAGMVGAPPVEEETNDAGKSQDLHTTGCDSNEGFATAPPPAKRRPTSVQHTREQRHVQRPEIAAFEAQLAASDTLDLAGASLTAHRNTMMNVASAQGRTNSNPLFVCHCDADNNNTTICRAGDVTMPALPSATGERTLAYVCHCLKHNLAIVCIDCAGHPEDARRIRDTILEPLQKWRRENDTGPVASVQIIDVSVTASSSVQSVRASDIVSAFGEEAIGFVSLTPTSSRVKGSRENGVSIGAIEACAQPLLYANTCRRLGMLASVCPRFYQAILPGTSNDGDAILPLKSGAIPLRFIRWSLGPEGDKLELCIDDKRARSLPVLAKRFDVSSVALDSGVSSAALDDGQQSSAHTVSPSAQIARDSAGCRVKEENIPAVETMATLSAKESQPASLPLPPPPMPTFSPSWHTTFGSWKLTILGTGCAEPSRNRASSGFLLEQSNYHCRHDVQAPCVPMPNKSPTMLWEAGDAVVPQMVHLFGLEGAQDRISRLQLVWVSHRHADHAGGLLHVVTMHKAHRAAKAPPLLVIGPTSVGAWLLETLRAEGEADPGAVVTFCHFDVFDWDAMSLPPRLERARAVLFDDCRVARLQSVPVEHCSDAWGLVITFYGADAGNSDDVKTVNGGQRNVTATCSVPDTYNTISAVPNESPPLMIPAAGVVGAAGCWRFSKFCSRRDLRIAFSGDTRPCEAFARAAEGAHLLVHEATFCAHRHSDAVFKRHSTAEEALDIAKSASAHRTLLTHFSQRYPGVLPYDAESEAGRCAACAFDGMSIKMSDLADLPTDMAAIRAILAPQARNRQRHAYQDSRSGHDSNDVENMGVRSLAMGKRDEGIDCKVVASGEVDGTISTSAPHSHTSRSASPEAGIVASSTGSAPGTAMTNTVGGSGTTRNSTVSTPPDFPAPPPELLKLLARSSSAKHIFFSD